MTYEAWRISFQSSEHAARAAWAGVERLVKERDEARRLLAEAERLIVLVMCAIVDTGGLNEYDKAQFMTDARALLKKLEEK